ncbi:hypothetical protein [Nonomuraea harbinensis]|uniref:Uncharacterized protein n=1 Tax=Nonomuraea harbinensis TaxID=1286938 RepID=A0ABW1BQW2_9ACTN|nr:hypothetical protein [Nonomuraea harbinensis]
MRDGGNSRRWLLVLASLTSLVMGGVAVLIGLEAMSWVASGVAAVFGVITASNEIARAGGDGPSDARTGGESSPNRPRRLTGQAWTAVLVGAMAVVFGAAVAFRLIVNPVGSETLTCPKPSDPITQAKVTSASTAAYPDLKIESFVYNVTYNGTDFMHLEATGRITGKVPEDQLLYPFGSADPRTRDAYGNAGVEGLFWGKDELIVPDQNGCWSKPQRRFGGYAGARGLTFYYHLGLVPHSQISCLDKVLSTKDAEDNGVEAADLTRCGVTLLGYAHIPTDPV